MSLQANREKQSSFQTDSTAPERHLPCEELEVGKLLLLQHDFCGFDDRRNRVSHLELHLLGAAFGDDAFDEVLANSDDHVSP